VAEYKLILESIQEKKGRACRRIDELKELSLWESSRQLMERAQIGLLKKVNDEIFHRES